VRIPRSPGYFSPRSIRPGWLGIHETILFFPLIAPISKHDETTETNNPFIFNIPYADWLLLIHEQTNPENP